MPLTESFANELADLLFENIRLENFGDAFGLDTPGAGAYYVRLHTASPTSDGSFSNEATFTGYAAQPIGLGSGWNVIEPTGETANVDKITFPECTGGSETITHFSLGKSATGTSPGGQPGGDMFIYGQLSTPRAVTSGTILEFDVGALTITIQS